MRYLITGILSLIMMLGFFLMLWSAVVFIQNKKFFSSAPKVIVDRVEVKKERFKGQHALGYILLVLSFILLVAPIVYGMYDGVKRGFNYWDFFIRFLVMTVSLKLFDIIFFDLVLLCHSNFFPHYYPEVKDLVGPQNFGYNKWTHIIHIIIFIGVSFLLAFIGTLF
ncbi:MAG: hypothetical protein K6F59_00105 [Gammaproteobacteria bacterium]|nr:hypothetical protein [Gammaproteobacteria bacterium]